MERDQKQWPDTYEAPTLEQLGSVWERTEGSLGSGSDNGLFAS